MEEATKLGATPREEDREEGNLLKEAEIDIRDIERPGSETEVGAGRGTLNGQGGGDAERHSAMRLSAAAGIREAGAPWRTH